MIELIRTRRSIRKFTEQAIEEDKIKLLQEALLRSPSSKNSNAWEFIFVDDPELISKLGESKPAGSAFLKGAKLAVVIVADTNNTGAWVEDCSIASIFLQMEAHELGLGSCWVQIHNRAHNDEMMAEDYIKNMLGMPKEFRVLNVVGIGYPEKIREGKPADQLQWEKIHQNSYGQHE